MEANKKIALRALTGAFVDRDPSVVEQFASDYIQHNPTIPSGPAAIKDLIPKLPKDFSYEPGMAVAEDDGRRRYISSGGRQGGRALGCNARGSSCVGHR